MPDAEPNKTDLDTGQVAKARDQNVESPLDPKTTVRLCTFSPCIEQVQRTISTLRQLGWVGIEMVEIAAKRIEVRRERVGLHEEGLRGVNVTPASVAEAVTRLREVEARFKSFHGEMTKHAEDPDFSPRASPMPLSTTNSTIQDRFGSIKEGLVDRKLYKDGRLVHRTEQELKTHTSYLVFALLPREWTTEEEEKCEQRWPAEAQFPATVGENMSRRQMKRVAKSKAGGNKAHEQMQEQMQEQATATAISNPLEPDQNHRDTEL